MEITIRSTVHGLKPKFRAVRGVDETEFDLKEGNKLFGTIVPINGGFSTRFNAETKKYQFNSDSVQNAIDDVTIFILLPKKIREAEEEIKALLQGSISLYIQFQYAAIEKDLLIEQQLRNTRKWLKNAYDGFDACHLRVAGTKPFFPERHPS